MKKKHYYLTNALKLSCAVAILFTQNPAIQAGNLPHNKLYEGHESIKQTITGLVVNEKKEPLIGVSILVKGTQIGTTTDGSGKFKIDVPSENAVLVFSSVGYNSQEIRVGTKSDWQIILIEDVASLEEVVVTGVFDKRTRMESSVAISTLNTKQIQLQAPLSAADLLKNISGVYVNSSTGEIRNTITSRGVHTGGNDGTNGYYYVSMQEDGLPVTNATYGNFGPDYFLRPDITLGKLEAVKGGTASILGNNAPGGIFNYVSKVGGTEFSVEARTKYGLEGNGKNPYYRFDANFGGPISKDGSMVYNIGGFWRQNDGARYAGYPMNEGGQIKGNIVKYLKNGSLKVYAKYFNDRNSFFEYLPTVGFTNPQLAPGVTQNSTVMIPPVTAEYTINDTGIKQKFDSRDKIHSKEISIGLNFDHNFGDGWVLDNKFRYSDKTTYWNITSVPYPAQLTNVVWYAMNNLAGKLGTYTFKDFATNQDLLKVIQGVNIVNGAPAGIKFSVAGGSLPGADILPNSLLYNPLIVFDNQVKETIDQLTLTKRLKNMSLTGGLYYAYSDVYRSNPGGIGAMFNQLSFPRPQATSITYTDNTGKVYQVTNPDGVTGGMGKSAATSIFDITQNQTALFLGHNWELSPKINLDWGIRYESIRVKGTNQVANQFTATDGGTDKNPLTLYDNTYGRIVKTYSYNKLVETFSFSGGINYKFSDQVAIYGRFSQGSKAPDLGIYLNTNTAADETFINPIAQKIQQLEAGVKVKKSNFSLFVTPFYSLLSNVPQQVQGQETADITSLYITPTLYNKYETLGIEFEGTYNFTPQFSVRSVATFQKSTALEFSTWDLGANGKADDKILTYSGNETDNNARVMLRVSPTYNLGKLTASLDWSYMGSRVANVPNAFKLPGFDQTNFNLLYSINKHLSLQANINNLFNQNGIMGWSAPGGFPASLNKQGFTKAMLDANPDVVYYTLSLPPRAYFLTVNYKF